MKDVEIDKLTLKLSGINEQDARRLAQIVGEGLARTQIAGGRSMMRVDVGVTPPATGGLSALSAAIVTEIVRQIPRST